MTADLFAALDLPLRFDIDVSDLEKRYFAAQRRFHPDRMVGKTAPERQQAILQSIQVNEAYEILKSPLKRARHLLALNGISSDTARPSQALLVEILELRETLAEAGDTDSLRKIGDQNEKSIAKTMNMLAQAFVTADYPKATELTMELSYLLKLEDEISVKLKVHAR